MLAVNQFVIYKLIVKLSFLIFALTTMKRLYSITFKGILKIQTSQNYNSQ